MRRYRPKHRANVSRTFFGEWLDAVAEANARTQGSGVRHRVERIGRRWAVMPTRPA